MVEKGKKRKVRGNNGQLMSLEDSNALDLALVEGLRRAALAASLSIASTPLGLTDLLAKPH